MKSNKYKFSLPINIIRDEDKNKISSLDFGKQIEILKEEKTTTEKYIIKKDNNLDTVNRGKVEEIKNPYLNLDLNKIRKDYEKKIQEKIKEIKGDYAESEKRDMVLIQLKTTTHYLETKQENGDKLNLELIKEKEEIEINKRINEIKSDESYYDKKLLVLNEMSTKKCYMDKEEVKQYIENKQKNKLEILNEKPKNLDGTPCTNITGDSTFQDSKEGKDQFPEENEKLLSFIFDDESKNVKLKLKEFNEARTQNYLKHKINDNLLTKVNQDSTLPEIYKLDDTNFAFVYENNLKTYPITLTESLKHTKNLIKANILDEPFGLHFCGKKIKLKGEIEIRECAPNNFICKECMEKNKKRFNLPDNYLININGRVSKIIRDKYHCLGTFGKCNSFAFCNNGFTCKACEILNSCKNYYFK